MRIVNEILLKNNRKTKEEQIFLKWFSSKEVAGSDSK